MDSKQWGNFRFIRHDDEMGWHNENVCRFVIENGNNACILIISYPQNNAIKATDLWLACKYADFWTCKKGSFRGKKCLFADLWFYGWTLLVLQSDVIGSILVRPYYLWSSDHRVFGRPTIESMNGIERDWTKYSVRNCTKQAKCAL